MNDKHFVKLVKISPVKLLCRTVCIVAIMVRGLNATHMFSKCTTSEAFLGILMFKTNKQYQWRI